MSTRKRVPVSQIKPGVYVVSLDKSWLQTPYYLHRRLIKNAEDIELLKKHGIREVVIDTAKGADVGELEPVAPMPANKNGSAVPKSSTDPSAPSERVFRPLVKEVRVARMIHTEAVALAQTIFEGAGGGAPVNSPAAKKVVTNLLGSITRSTEASLLLSQMRRFQNDLFTHAVNVCVLSLVIGTLEGLDGEIQALGLGALLHDVGETRIPRNLIRKKGAYSESEQRLLEQHPRLGAVLLQQSENIPELARRIVLEHHERIDGSGYPFGLRGEQISVFSQIVSITDTYDGMLMGRNHAPLPPTEVLRQLYVQRNAGIFDSDLVERIIRCLGVYPVGSLVRLNTGEQGIVVAANRMDSLKPTVRIIMSSTGLAQPHGPIVSLADKGTGAVERCIVHALDPIKEGIDLLSYLNLAPTIPT